MRADLKLARIEGVDAEGLYADLHALGKSFITAMAVSGMSQRAPRPSPGTRTRDSAPALYR